MTLQLVCMESMDICSMELEGKRSRNYSSNSKKQEASSNDRGPTYDLLHAMNCQQQR